MVAGEDFPSWKSGVIMIIPTGEMVAGEDILS